MPAVGFSILGDEPLGMAAPALPATMPASTTADDAASRPDVTTRFRRDFCMGVLLFVGVVVIKLP